jgi:hypothetical protein
MNIFGVMGLSVLVFLVGLSFGVSIMEKYIEEKCDKKEDIYTNGRRFRVYEQEAPK